MTQVRERCICFAYFTDDQFIGWYGDSMGSVVKNSPKIYPDTEKQKEVIRTNFTSKIKKIKDVPIENPKEAMKSSNRGEQLVGLLDYLRRESTELEERVLRSKK